MKRVLIVFVLLLIIPCFASNNLQLQAENEVYKNFSNMSKEKLISLIQIPLIKDDFITYENDKNSDTMYLRLLNEKSKFCDSLNSEDIIKCNYIKKLKKNI